jgi:hypothetical protein
MNELNEYLKSKFDRLPLSHQVFRPIATNDSRGNRRTGKDIDKRYRLQYIEFNGFYKPITTYL